MVSIKWEVLSLTFIIFSQTTCKVLFPTGQYYMGVGTCILKLDCLGSKPCFIIINSVTLDTLLNFSVPQFLHLQSEPDIGTYLIWFE